VSGLSLPIWARALAATLLVQILSSLGGASVPLLGPLLTQRWGIAPEGIGYVQAAVSVGICWYLACGGPMLGHLGAVRSLQAGLLAVAAGLALMAQPHWLSGLGGALLLGLGLGPNTPAGSQVLMRTAPPRHRSLIFSIKQAGVPLGGALAGLVVAELVTRFGTDVAIGLVAAAMLAALVAVQPERRRLDEERGARHPGWPRLFLSPAGFWGSVGVVRHYRELPLLTVIGISFSIAQACVTAFTATYLVTRHGRSLAEAGQMMAVLLASSALARIGFGWLADRIGNGMLLLGLIALAASAAIVLMVAVDMTASWLPYLSLALVGASTMGWNGVHMAELARISPLEHVGEVTSAASLFGFVGAVCGPMAFALIAAKTGSFAAAFAVAAVQLSAIGIVALVHGARPGRVR
jgi:MFS family permease